MKVVIQRVKEASVSIDGKIISKINNGLLLFVGFKIYDNVDDIDYMVDKILNLRIFEDNDKMNLSVKDVQGGILSVSQFTLYADTKKGCRPSFTSAMKYDDAIKMYDIFNDKLKKKYDNIETGIFGADMKINLINDGPVTILLEE